MKIDSSEIASLIKAQIKGYEQELKEDDVGTVISVGDGIALCYGLNNAMLGELLIFPHDVYGMVMNLDTEDVGCVLLGSDYEILEGDTVKRTHKVVEVPVGDGLYRALLVLERRRRIYCWHYVYPFFSPYYGLFNGCYCAT